MPLCFIVDAMLPHWSAVVCDQICSHAPGVRLCLRGPAHVTYDVASYRLNSIQWLEFQLIIATSRMTLWVPERRNEFFARMHRVSWLVEGTR